MAGPFTSPSTAVGLPQKARMVESTLPTTGPGEGLVFVSDGSSGLNVNEPYFVPENNGTPINILQGTPGPEDLAFTLTVGNFTGGTDIVLTNGDAIRSENSGVGIPGRPVVLAPGSVVGPDVEGALLWGSSYASLTRGKAAIDMQFGRSAGTQRVQPGSNYAAIVGGRHHTISTTSDGDHSGIFAGESNTISGFWTNNAVIVGGSGNTITGTSATHHQGNVTGSAIIGGQNNTISGGGATVNSTYFAFIGAGKNNYIGYHGYCSALFGANNTIDGNFGGAGFWASYAFAAGKNNTIGGHPTVGGGYHSACFGRDNTILGSQDSFAIGRFNYIGGPAPAYGSCSMAGGHTNTMRSYCSFMWGKDNASHSRAHFSATFGQGAYAYSTQQLVLGAGGTAGSAQVSTFVRAVQTTNATPKTITSIFDRIYIPANRSLGFRITLTARQTAGAAGTIGDSAMWVITGLIKRDGANNTVLVGVPTGTGTPSAFTDAGASTWVVAVAADDVNEALGVTVTGQLSKTISWTWAVYDSEAG